jgi:hypothetical protein
VSLSSQRCVLPPRVHGAAKLERFGSNTAPLVPHPAKHLENFPQHEAARTFLNLGRKEQRAHGHGLRIKLQERNAVIEALCERLSRSKHGLRKA